MALYPVFTCIGVFNFIKISRKFIRFPYLFDLTTEGRHLKLIFPLFFINKRFIIMIHLENASFFYVHTAAPSLGSDEKFYFFFTERK